MGRTTKIDWCDSTWNPVTGCLHGCDYCYARKQAHRFDGKLGSTGENHDLLARVQNAWRDEESSEMVFGRVEPYPYGFDPTFHRYRLGQPKKWREPRNIFVCSTADLFGAWVPDEWIEEVFRACEAVPRHRYLFLTKNPGRYQKLNLAGKLPRDDNMYYGTTVTEDGQYFFQSPHYHSFLSIEPIHGDFDSSLFGAEWIIIGAETGKRKDKVVPKREWIEHVVQRRYRGWAQVFMKESLRGLMGDDFRQEFPWEV